MTISGRKDAKQGNFVFKYDTENEILKLKSISGKEIVITGKDRNTVVWSIEDHGDYYIFKYIVELPKNTDSNYSKDGDIVSYDINYNHIAWCDLNKQGSIIEKGIIKYNLDGKTSNQTTNIIENAIKQ